MIWGLLLLAGLACGRATRLVVGDTFPFGPAQDWLKRNHEDSWLQLMVSCPWCLSGWLTLAATVGLEARHSVPAPPLAWFAAWWVAVTSYWISEVLAKYGAEDEEPDDELKLDPDGFS